MLGDEPVLSAARQQIRSGFRDKSSLELSDPALGPAIQHAEDVARILRANVVQGRREGSLLYSRCGMRVALACELGVPNADRSTTELRIHEDTERGDNDSVKTPGDMSLGAMAGSCRDR